MTKEQLADEVVRLAKENVKLKDNNSHLEHANFWLLTKETNQQGIPL